MIAWCALVALALGQTGPSDQTLIYYNARMALRESRPLEATKLWLLRNAVETQTHHVSEHDADFGSVTWAALGELGICQDGHPTDEDGAGLWPLAFHNWVVRNRNRKGHTKKPRPFQAFEVGRQQRFVSIGDVLGSDELKTVSLFRGRCVRPKVALIEAGEGVTAKLSDRAVAARFLKALLERSRDTLVHERVRGEAAIDARLFDIHLQLAELAAREARTESWSRSRRARELGLSRESIQALRDGAPLYTLDPDSEPAHILRDCVTWSIDEWMALSPDRRLFLFDHAKRFGGAPAEMDRIALGILDRLVDAGEGEEVDRWIAHRSEDPAAQDAIWKGERGQRILALDDESGFGERSVIALKRGVDLLERGDLPGALRAMAFALQHAPESRAADDVQGLSLRWMSYIAAQFEITDELLVTLQQLVPRREFSLLLEDILWGAAFHADRASFERGVRNQSGRGALNRRIDLLEPLSRGDVGGFASGVATQLEDSPSETLRFLDQLVQRLELEDGDVRRAQVPTVRRIRLLLAPRADAAATGGEARRASALMARTQAILEGLGALDETTDRDRARSLDPSSEVFAGNVRLAPVDPLPWPFRASEVAAPSIFEPLDLTPVEWRGSDGEWVFGWSIAG